MLSDKAKHLVEAGIKVSNGKIAKADVARAVKILASIPSLTLEEKMKFLEDFHKWTGGDIPSTTSLDRSNLYCINKCGDKAVAFYDWCREIFADDIKELLPLYNKFTDKFEKLLGNSEFFIIKKTVEELRNLSGKATSNTATSSHVCTIHYGKPFDHDSDEGQDTMILVQDTINDCLGNGYSQSEKTIDKDGLVTASIFSIYNPKSGFESEIKSSVSKISNVSKVEVLPDTSYTEWSEYE